MHEICMIPWTQYRPLATVREEGKEEEVVVFITTISDSLRGFCLPLHYCVVVHPGMSMFGGCVHLSLYLIPRDSLYNNLGLKVTNRIHRGITRANVRG